MPGPLDTKAELRHAVRRLIAALRGTSARVEVERRDLELVMSLAAARLYDRAIRDGSHPRLTPNPNLHPYQR